MEPLSPSLPPHQHETEAKLPAGPHQPAQGPADVFEMVGQDVTSVGQTKEANAEVVMPTEEAKLMEEEAEPEVSTSVSGDKQSDAEEENEQEEEGAESEVGSGAQNHARDSPATSKTSRSARSAHNKHPLVPYNTVCYRKIKKGSTRQRIDEFESMMSV